ncbi:MAG: hypothetical protein IJE43_16365 [Alphaproteobacteria bacterium]|nr:hypothetical protein [Alphaproteobacteria bacterium]
MKKTSIVLLCLLLLGCSNEVLYPYGLTESEWNSLSIRDQAKLRRDFYFYEKGETDYVSKDIELEGKKEPVYHQMY